MAVHRYLPFMTAILLAPFWHASAQIPVIRSIGPEESVSSSYMERPSVAADSKGQPHFVCDRGGMLSSSVMKFHRINGKWRGGVFATGSPGGRYDAGRLYIGQMEIDAKDRAWISCKFGCKEYGSMLGQGVWLYRNITTAPVEQMFRHVNVYKGMGVVSLDAKYPDQGVVLGTFGNWQKLSQYGQSLGSGTINAGHGGEKVRMRIASYAPKYRARGDTRVYPDGIWHTAMNGGPIDSMYQNSARYKAGLGPVPWASKSTFPEMGDDFHHPGIGVDATDPKMAYIASVFLGHLYMNIWDGSKMLFPINSLRMIDADATFEERHAPAITPAPDGGAFFFWTSNNRIKGAYVSKKGVRAAPFVVTAGRSAGAATDRYGHIHLVYYNGGIKYRKIQTASLSPLHPAGRIEGTRKPVFKWTGTQGKVYSIELTRDGVKQKPFGVKAATWTPPADLAVGAYSWRVKEGWPGGSAAWSKSLAFEISPARPTPVGPSIRYPTAPHKPFFTWINNEPTAGRFQLQLFRGTESLGSITVSGVNYAKWSSRLGAGSYSWRIRTLRTRNKHTIASSWTPHMEFQIAVPGGCAIRSPASLAVFEPGWQTIACDWTLAEGASSYRLDLLFNGKLLEKRSGISGTTYRMSKAYEPGYYSFLVQPRNSSGTGPWTPVRTFIVTRQMTPGHNVTRISPPAAFEWTRSPNATRYLVKLSAYNATQKAFKVVLEKWVPQPKWGTPTWRPSYTFANNAYRWSVTDYEGKKQNFSSVAFFQVRVPGHPNLLSPKGVFYGHRLLPFEWQDPSRFAEAFQLQIWKGDNKLKDTGWISAVELDKALARFRKTYSFPDAGSGACVWTVRGKNSNGAGPWRQASFNALPLDTPVFTSPADGAQVAAGTPLVFTWTAVSNAAHYGIEILENDRLVASDLVTDTQWEWTPTTTGDFTAQVRAGDTGWSWRTNRVFSAVAE